MVVRCFYRSALLVIVSSGANLAADLATRVERGRVHVRVRNTSANGGEDLGKFAGQDLLTRGAGGYYVGRCDAPGYAP